MLQPRKTWLAIALTAVAGFEGLRTVAYLDPVSIPTLCFGHTAGVQMGDTATPEQCRDVLEAELVGYGLAVSNAVTVPLSPGEQAAYTSFAYNVGIGAFERSTLLRKLHSGDRVGACNELTRWVYAGGIKLPGLVKRREAERQMCLAGVNENKG